MPSDESDAGTKRVVVESVTIAATLVAVMMALILSVAYLGGYPGFSGEWLVAVVAPTYLAVTAIVAGAIGFRDWARRRWEVPYA